MAAAPEGIGGFYGSPNQVSDVYRRLTHRKQAPILDSVRQLAEDEPVFIFNVSPWKYSRRMGNHGTFVIKGCLEGQEHSEPLRLPGIIFMPYPDSETTDKIIMESGKHLAGQIVGLGAHNLPANSLARCGVAICEQWPPTKDQIAAAKKALHEGELASLIREADSAIGQGPKAAEDTIRGRHHEAARILRLSAAEHPWIGRAMAATSREDCKFCGEPMRKGLARCPNCKEIVDQALYDKLKGVEPAKK